MREERPRSWGSAVFCPFFAKASKGLLWQKGFALRRLEGSDLGGVAPDAHDAFDADGADADPDDDAGGEAGELGAAAFDDGFLDPGGLVVGIAEVGLDFVGAGGLLGFVAGDDDAAEFAMGEADVLGGGGWGGIGWVGGFVGGEAAEVDDVAVADGDGVDVVAEFFHAGVHVGAGGVEGVDVADGTAGTGLEFGVVVVDLGLEVGEGEGWIDEGGGVGAEIGVDDLGEGAEIGGGVVAVVDDGFAVVHFSFGWGECLAVPGEGRAGIPGEGGGVPMERVRHGVCGFAGKGPG